MTKKPMTLNALIKALQAIQRKGGGRSRVVVNTTTLDDGNGTFNCCNIYEAKAEVIDVCDGDGFTVENKDGSTRTFHAVTLRGRWWDEKGGQS